MSDGRARRARSTGGVPVWPAVLMLLLVVVAVAGLAWHNAKRGHIDLPPTSASPEQVVRAYADALNADDCVTASMLAPSVGARWCGTTVSDLQVTGTTTERRPAQAGTGPTAERVSVRMTTHGRAVPEGAHAWHFLLARTGPGGAWRIYDQGQD